MCSQTPFIRVPQHKPQKPLFATSLSLNLLYITLAILGIEKFDHPTPSLLSKLSSVWIVESLPGSLEEFLDHNSLDNLVHPVIILSSNHLD